MQTRLTQWARFGLFVFIVNWCVIGTAAAAPYAAMVMDARTGKVLLAENADTRLHPASLTKMMTLYVTFDAIKRGELSLDDTIKISKKAASEQPSKLGLKPGQRIKLRYLVRAAAVKSANDAATALAEAVSGSEAAFARRMNRTAKALGMTRTTFKNAHGLTETGHMSTARDMTLLGRHLLFDHNEYYNLFSRTTTDAGVRQVNNTNRRFLAAYKGADGIKTGYTRAAGFNLVASAERGNERIIATMFGGRSTAQRNAKVAELLDFGFRKAPSNATTRAPKKPVIEFGPNADEEVAPGKVFRVVRAVKTSPFPTPRPGKAIEDIPEEMLVAMAETIQEAVTAVQLQTPVAVVKPVPVTRPETVETAALTAAPATNLAPAPAPALKPALAAILPTPRPEKPVLASVAPTTSPEPIVVTRLSTSGARHWGINVGRYGSQYKAERVLLKTALSELDSLGSALRKVATHRQGFDANFVGLTKEGADRACRRLNARNVTCTTLGPA